MEVRGKQEGVDEMLTFALPAPIDSTIVWNTCSYVKIDENLSFRKIEGIVFHSKDYPEAQVKVTVWCVYDKAKNSVQVIKEDMQKAAESFHKDVLTLMDEMKDVANAAEEKIPDEELPYPTYDQMLFYV